MLAIALLGPSSSDGSSGIGWRCELSAAAGKRFADRRSVLGQRGAKSLWQCGELLKEAKSQLRHGQWGDWLRKNFDFNQREAERWMKLAGRMEFRSAEGGSTTASQPSQPTHGHPAHSPRSRSYAS